MTRTLPSRRVYSPDSTSLKPRPPRRGARLVIPHSAGTDAGNLAAISQMGPNSAGAKPVT